MDYLTSLNKKSKERGKLLRTKQKIYTLDGFFEIDAFPHKGDDEMQNREFLELMTKTGYYRPNNLDQENAS